MLTAEHVTKAWKDDEYMAQLPEDVRSQIPPAPEGASSMSDAELEQAAGGFLDGLDISVDVGPDINVDIW